MAPWTVGKREHSSKHGLKQHAVSMATNACDEDARQRQACKNQSCVQSAKLGRSHNFLHQHISTCIEIYHKDESVVSNYCKSC